METVLTTVKTILGKIIKTKKKTNKKTHFIQDYNNLIGFLLVTRHYNK